MITLTTSLPPSKNKQYGRSRRGGVYLLPEVRAYRAEVGYRVALVRGSLRLAVPCRLTAVFHPWRAGRFDQSNRLAQLCDALEYAGVVADDKWFTCTTSELGAIIRPRGLCVVTIEEIGAHVKTQDTDHAG